MLSSPLLSLFSWSRNQSLPYDFFIQKIRPHIRQGKPFFPSYKNAYVLPVVEIAFNVEGVGKGHKYLFLFFDFLNGLDRSLALLILVKCKPELIQGLSKRGNFIFEPLLELIEFLGIKLLQVDFLGH